MAITYDMRQPREGRRTAAWAVASATDRARAFAAARRHSYLVRFLRLALPVAAVVLLVVYLGVLIISWRLSTGNLQVGAVHITADDLTMKNPSYFGVTKDGGKYRVQANRAVVGLNQNAPIKLIDISGELIQANKQTTHLKAKHGLFDNPKGELELFDGIEINGANGLTARLSRAFVYSKENKIVSRDPVVATTPTGAVQAAAMTIDTKARAVAFRGAVSVRMLPGTQGPVALGRDPKQPVDIYAEELDIDDAQKTAHFRGNVVATQGETTLKTPYLFVKYEGKAAAGMPGLAQPGEQGNTRVTFLWARNGVDITAGADRRVVSDLADFDAVAETALFIGNVHVTQEKNVLTGGRLYIDRKTGRSRLDDAPPSHNRIAASFYQNDTKGPKAPSVAAASGSGSMMESFKSDPSAPIDIEADNLEVADAAKKAVFSGNVWAQQGSMVIRTVELTAIFSGQNGLGLVGSGGEAGKASAAQIVRVEAKQKVLITTKDGQSATADWANFDVKANTALLGGNVVVMRGKDIVEGSRLKLDLTTGLYRFEDEPGAKQPLVTGSAPSTSSAPPASNEGRSCPPGKQCMLFYPKDAKDKAKDLLKKAPSGNGH